jgi:uncharacterized membrane protein
MELLDILEHGLTEIVEFGEFLLEAIAVLCVLFGLLKTLQLAYQSRRRYHDIPFLQVRTQFGVWLAIALEFQLGADILSTTVTPSTDGLIQLGAIAVIRTFLNYFLNKELEKQLELQTKKSQQQDS